MEKQKYIKTKQGEIIIFPCELEHSDFKYFCPVSAGFCYIRENIVDCFGESISLNLKSDMKEDSIQATKQIHGIDAMLKLL